jgi:hypothetical protein
VHAATLHGAVSLSAALQACATPAEVVVTDRSRLARPDPQSTVQSLQPDQAEMAQSVHVKAAHGMVSVSPPHGAPPKAAASITNLKRDEDPAASQTAVESHSKGHAGGSEKGLHGRMRAYTVTYVRHPLRLPDPFEQADRTFSHMRFDWLRWELVSYRSKDLSKSAKASMLSPRSRRDKTASHTTRTRR